MKKVAVVILNYNGVEHLKKHLNNVQSAIAVFLLTPALALMAIPQRR